MRQTFRQTFHRLCLGLVCISTFPLFMLVGCNKVARLSVDNQTSTVMLKPGLSYGEVKKMLNEPPDSSHRVQATVIVKFLQSGVKLAFYKPSDKTSILEDRDTPFSLVTDARFRGTVCGIHNGDPTSQATSLVRLSYPAAKRPDGITVNGDRLILDGTNWQISWSGTNSVRALTLENKIYRNR